MAGVTLIELLIAVVIVGILAAIAYPSYRGSVVAGRRSDGQGTLLQAAQRLERCFTQFNAYDDEDCAVSFPIASPEGFYEIDTEELTAEAFTLTATPQGTQADDTQCATLSITNTGERSASGTDAARCW
jgi:type IV pilus assembly protein PilE